MAESSFGEAENIRMLEQISASDAKLFELEASLRTARASSVELKSRLDEMEVERENSIMIDGGAAGASLGAGISAELRQHGFKSTASAVVVLEGGASEVESTELIILRSEVNSDSLV